jgi:predicted transcriptional regulator
MIEVIKMNRKKWFTELFKSKSLNTNDVAEKMNIKRDSLYRKIIGVNGFNEKDINKILSVLNMKYEDVFIKEN